MWKSFFRFGVGRCRLTASQPRLHCFCCCFNGFASFFKCNLFPFKLRFRHIANEIAINQLKHFAWRTFQRRQHVWRCHRHRCHFHRHRHHDIERTIYFWHFFSCIFTHTHCQWVTLIRWYRLRLSSYTSIALQ